MTLEVELACPHYGRVNEAHAGPDPDTEPAPGDISICWACHGIGVFTDDGIRKPTADEQAELDTDPDIRAALAAMAESYTPAEASQLRWGTS